MSGKVDGSESLRLFLFRKHSERGKTEAAFGRGREKRILDIGLVVAADGQLGQLSYETRMQGSIVALLNAVRRGPSEFSPRACG